MKELINISNLSLPELQAIGAQVIQAQLSKVIDEVAAIKDNQEKLSKRIEIQEEETKHELNKIQQLALSSLRAKEPKYGWMTLRDLGLQFNTTISNIRMGKLLRVVGLAQRGKTRTIPYRHNVGKERYAISQVTESGTTIIWNYKRVMNHIDMWLEKHGYYTEFYRLQELGSEKEVARFIDKLHEQYGR
ncbi:MAG: hypothetical protein IRZ03_17380 [Acidobacterium ailaaui]|nr:hypothetical protein [Pseudacidobacterium ailaaui]